MAVIGFEGCTRVLNAVTVTVKAHINYVHAPSMKHHNFLISCVITSEADTLRKQQNQENNNSDFIPARVHRTTQIGKGRIQHSSYNHHTQN